MLLLFGEERFGFCPEGVYLLASFSKVFEDGFDVRYLVCCI